MSLKRAAVPWNGRNGQGRGRPRKEAFGRAGVPGCVWPDPEGPCRAQGKPGLALCGRHAEILLRPGHSCQWPGCIQSSYGGCCAYHHKIVHLLIDAPRGRSEVL